MLSLFEDILIFKAKGGKAVNSAVPFLNVSDTLGHFVFISD